MSLFNLDIPLPEKVITKHPWEKTLKDEHVSKGKYAHNSITNPQIPKKEEKKPEKDRVRFTIIGNIITKEFNYCVKLIKGIHKYKWRKFDNPVIRGVTSVEWPSIWEDLKIRYGGLAYCIQSQVAVIINNNLLGGEKELKQMIESKYTYHLTLDYYKESVKQFSSFVKSTGRPFTYMHFSIDEKHIGTMIFMLYDDIVPYTCENFLRLCKNTKGGYSGTPVHRIVKDGWIQCGGYGLRSTDLGCENFMVPHDRRGVLCMANDGRHVDCSTQFFILLQPAQWMAQKYVAFGQLVDGVKVLEKIEHVPCWYESPEQEIMIYRSGILNMDCQEIKISKITREYINGHVDDLIAIGEIFLEELMQRVFAEIEERRRKRDMAKEEVGEEDAGEEGGVANIRETERFVRNKEDIDKHLQSSQIANRRGTSVISEPQVQEDDVNAEDFDYEPEEREAYQHVSLAHSGSTIIKPVKPYYFPLEDVPYPGETDSTYDLKKLLRGDYCLEVDLESKAPKKSADQKRVSYAFTSDLLNVDTDETSDTESDDSLDSDDEREIKNYLKEHVDRVSFAGGIIKGIAKGKAKFNLFEGYKTSDLVTELTDDELRRYRLASVDFRSRDNKKVSISVPNEQKEERTKIKRRQTGFVRPVDLEKLQRLDSVSYPIHEDDSNTSAARKVRIADTTVKSKAAIRSGRRPTGFPKPAERFSERMSMEIDSNRPSVLQRLYDDVTTIEDDHGPTLKDFKTKTETHMESMLLTYSPNSRIKSDDDSRDRLIMRHSLTVEDSHEQVLNLQHGKKVARKISSDYVKTIDQIEQKPQEVSIRTLEYAKTRPAMSVSEYQMKNQRYKDSQGSELNPSSDKMQYSSAKSGVRLPGDTPLYSLTDAHQDLSQQKHVRMSKVNTILRKTL